MIRYLAGTDERKEDVRQNGDAIRSAKGEPQKAPAIPMFHEIVEFGEKVHLAALMPIEEGIVDDEEAVPLCEEQPLNGHITEAQQETPPVNPGVLNKA